MLSFSIHLVSKHGGLFFFFFFFQILIFFNLVIFKKIKNKKIRKIKLIYINKKFQNFLNSFVKTKFATKKNIDSKSPLSFGGTLYIKSLVGVGSNSLEISLGFR